jgi:hypothetical protein
LKPTAPCVRGGGGGGTILASPIDLRCDGRVRGIGYRLRAELRGRWLGWVTLGAFVGIVGAMVVVLAAGALRTHTAHERFLTGASAYDLGVVTYCARNVDLVRDPDKHEGCQEEVARLAAVRDATVVTEIPAVVTDTDGRLLQPDPADACYSGPGEVGVYTDLSGRFGTEINRQRIVAGRRADPTRADEVEISAHTADRLGLAPGSELLIHLLHTTECDDEYDLDDVMRVRIVGVQRSPGEVPPPSGFFVQTVGVTPAFVDAAGKRLAERDYLAVRLHRGATIETLQAQATAAGYSVFVVLSRTENEDAIDRAISPSVVSLTVLALMIALAGMAVLGQLLVHHASAVSGDESMLAALGMGRGQRFMLGMLRAGVVAIVAAPVAVLVGILASPLMPIGVARTLEPDPGIAFDPLVPALGAVGTFVFVIAVSAIPAWRATAAHRTTRAPRSGVTRAALTTRAARAGLSPVAVSGARFALERGSGRAAVPVVSSFLGLAIAIAAIVGALTFGTSLAHLRSSPELVGWNWDVMLSNPDTEQVPPDVARVRLREMLDAHAGVAQYATGLFFAPFPQGVIPLAGPDRIEIDGFAAFDSAAPFGPSVISGRRPQAPNEVLFGEDSLAEVGARVGDEIDVFGRNGPWGKPGAETRVRMRIVGTGAIALASRIGRGLAVTLDGAQLLNDQPQGTMFYVRLRPGTDAHALIDGARRAFPEASPESIELIGADDWTNPSLNLEQISAVPGLFATLLGIMAVGVLVHVLSAATRARRRDLGVLRALGFSRAQAMRAVAYQAVIYAVLALAVAIPVGIAIGRLAWHAYASSLYVVSEPMTSVATCAAVAAVTLIATMLVALPLNWVATRVQPAAALRTE